MTSKVIKTITEHHMISKGDTVGVGLSGGADSVALLHILVSNKKSLGIEKIKGIHIHHGIRGEEADRDLNFSKDLCNKLDIEFVCFYADVPSEAKKSGESIEQCARRMRYDFFSQTSHFFMAFMELTIAISLPKPPALVTTKAPSSTPPHIFPQGKNGSASPNISI